MNRILLRVGRDTTLKSFLLTDSGISKRTLARLKRMDKGITRNGIVLKAPDRVFKGDEILLSFSDKTLLSPNKELRVDIAFENENTVVFDKPVGMPVHPSVKHRDDTLGNYFAHIYPGVTFRPVNRLDRDTSGLCLVAKNAVAAAALRDNIKKVYYAVVTGRMEGEGTIDAPIAREQQSIIKRTVREDGRRAVTHYKVLRSNEKYSLLEIYLETGRTHQIRVHFSHIGHPLAGDDLYGGCCDDIEYQALHCGKITFPEPLTHEIIELNSPLRADINKII